MSAALLILWEIPSTGLTEKEVLSSGAGIREGQDRIHQGKKVLSCDEQYLRKAEELLYSEMALSLAIPKEKVEEYITEAVEKRENG